MKSFKMAQTVWAITQKARLGYGPLWPMPISPQDNCKFGQPRSSRAGHNSSINSTSCFYVGIDFSLLNINLVAALGKIERKVRKERTLDPLLEVFVFLEFCLILIKIRASTYTCSSNLVLRKENLQVKRLHQLKYTLCCMYLDHN